MGGKSKVSALAGISEPLLSSHSSSSSDSVKISTIIVGPAALLRRSSIRAERDADVAGATGTGKGEGMEDEAPSKNNLQTLNGVFVPCLLNILGIILFLRLTWAVGQAGWLGVGAMFMLGETQTVLTVLSIAALTSNGTMKGGGSYFLISRSLGPELGGAIGVMFYLAYAVGTAFYAIGVGSELQAVFYADTDDVQQMTIILSSITLVVVLGVSLLGAHFFTKINVIMFAIQMGAITLSVFSMWVREPNSKLDSGGELLKPTWTRFMSNMMPAYEESDQCAGQEACDFRGVFSIIFPAMTGIMEGANLSGDLENPSRSIGPGTLMAVGAAICVYLLIIMSSSSAFDRRTLLRNNIAFQEVSMVPLFSLAGVIIASGSSALGSMFGGSRILQALASDDIFPGLSFFAKGSKKGNEPYRAVVVTYLIAQATVMIGNIDVVAPIISSFFCLTYALTNLTCVLLKLSGTLNFRPEFKYWSWHTALAGFLLNVVVMFWIDWWQATLAVVIMIVLYTWVHMMKREFAWGDVSQALMFHQVRKYLLRLHHEKQHGKTWRPSLLLIVNSPANPLVKFCNGLKKGGLYCLGTVLEGYISNEFTQASKIIRNAWHKECLKGGVKAFPTVIISRSLGEGHTDLIQTAGIGAMEPNTVVLPILRDRTDHILATDASETLLASKSRAEKREHIVVNATFKASVISSDLNGDVAVPELEGSKMAVVREAMLRLMTEQEYVWLLCDAGRLGKNLLVACNFQDFTILEKNVSDVGVELGCFVDVWLTEPPAAMESWEAFEANCVFALQMAHIAILNSHNDDLHMRVFKIMQDDSAEARERFERLMGQARLPIHSIVYLRSPSLSLNYGLGSPSPCAADHVDDIMDAPALMRQESKLQALVLDHKQAVQLNAVIKRHSALSRLIFIPLPRPPRAFTHDHADAKRMADASGKQREAARTYLRVVNSLVGDLPPVCLAQPDRAADRIPIMALSV